MKRFRVVVALVCIIFFSSLVLIPFGNAATGATASSVVTPTLIWKYTLPSYTVGVAPPEVENPCFESPSVVDDMVYIGCGGANLASDEGLYAFDTSNGDSLWNYTTGFMVGASPTIFNRVIYFGCDNGNVYALNASSGDKLWSYSTGNFIDSSPAVVGDIVYIGSADGNTYALNATDGARLWYSVIGGSFVYSCVTVVNGLVFVDSAAGFVYALNASSGIKMWYYGTGNEINSPPVVTGGTVYVCNENNVYALNAANGDKIWNYSVSRVALRQGFGPGGFNSSPSVVNGVVYVGNGYNGNIYALNATNGAELWSCNTGGAVNSSPAVVSGTVYIGSEDAKIYALNAATGIEIWNYTADGAIDSSPAVANSVIYIGSNYGTVYALGLPASLASTSPTVPEFSSAIICITVIIAVTATILFVLKNEKRNETRRCLLPLTVLRR